MRRGAALAAALVWAAAASPAAGQAALRFAADVVPETVTVGDPFRLRVRAELPAERLRFPPLAASPELQPLRPPRVRPLAPGETLAEFPLAAWRPGPPRDLLLPVAVRGPGGAVRTVRLRIALPAVRSVLPPGNSAPRPRPAKPILAASRTPLLLALAAGALLGGAALVWLLRRRRRSVPAAAEPPAPDPWQRALAELDAAAALRERGELGAFYDAFSGALRGLLARVDRRWGSELTTAELLAGMRSAGAPPGRTGALAALLGAADRAKFAGERPDGAEAERDEAAARDWVLAGRPGAREAA